MIAKTNLIISIFLIILIVLYKVFIIKKYKNIYQKGLYKEANKFIKLLIFLSFIIFIISLIINFINIEEYLVIEIITAIINSLSISLLAFPLSINTLYLTSFKDEEKYSHIKTLVTNIYDLKLIKKFNNAGINVIILSKDKIDSKIKIIKEDEIDSKYLSKNLIIETNNHKILKEYIEEENIYYEFNDLDECYQTIYKARGIHDNYIRTIKYNLTTYLPLLINFFILSMTGFPIIYNILLIVLLKIYTILISEFVYKKMAYDIDIMKRKQVPENILIGRQELLISMMISFCIAFTLTVPYMFILAQGGSEELANTLYLIIFIYLNIFMTISYISEASFIKNIIKVFKDIYLLIYIIVSILFTIILNYTTYFNTRNIEIHNYLGCIVFALIPVIFYELTKFARFTTTKRRK